MKTGNAIAGVFFIWLGIDLPMKLYTLNETYSIIHEISTYINIPIEALVLFANVFPLMIGTMFFITGRNQTIETNNTTQETKNKDTSIHTTIPIKKGTYKPEGTKIGQQQNNRKTTAEIEKHIDQLKNKDLPLLEPVEKEKHEKIS